VKGVWSIIISIPVIIIVIFEKNPQEFITYTGGICGTFILFFIPLTLVWHARNKKLEDTYGENFNKSPFKHKAFLIIVLVFAVLTLSAVITGLIIKGTHGGH
jgi:heme A synthase